MKLQDSEIIRSCRCREARLGLFEGCYYVVLGEYKDLISEEKRVIVHSNNGRQDYPKEVFDSFENISYRFHKKLKTEAGF